MAASPKKYDIFDIVFDVLSDSLTTNTPSINLACNIEDKLTNIVWKEIKHKSTLRMNELRHMRQLMIKRYMTLISVKLQSLRTVEESKRLHLESCSCQEVSTKRRLTIQKTGSDKRLKELVFEIIGEYGKSNVRITRRRSEYSVYSVSSVNSVSSLYSVYTQYLLHPISAVVQSPSSIGCCDFSWFESNLALHRFVKIRVIGITFPMQGNRGDRGDRVHSV